MSASITCIVDLNDGAIYFSYRLVRVDLLEAPLNDYFTTGIHNSTRIDIYT